MLDREPFLRAIFADPAADLPRLVFADYLDEHGADAWATAIRNGVELSRLGDDDPAGRATLLEALTNAGFADRTERGFVPSLPMSFGAQELMNVDALRLRSVTAEPHWFGATKLKVSGGQILTTEPLRTILTLPAFENVVELDLSGTVVEIPMELPEDEDGESLMLLYDMETRPVMTVRMVEELAEMRECRRITSLDLRNNELDNDAVRALADSRNFIRLKHLFLGEGNRFKGRTWARVFERYGQDVVQ